MSHYSYKVFVFFNGVKPRVDFMLLEDTTCLALLRSKLNNMLLITNNRKVKNDDDMKVMRRKYHLTKGLIEFEVKISRFADDIEKMLKHPKFIW